MGALLDAIIGAQYRPLDNMYGIGAAGVADALPMLSNPYGSTSKNALYTGAGALLAGVLANYARRESDNQNKALFNAALSMRGMSPQSMQSAIASEPRLASYGSALLEQQQLQELERQKLEQQNEFEIKKAKEIKDYEMRLSDPFKYKFAVENGLVNPPVGGQGTTEVIQSQASGQATGEQLSKTLQQLGQYSAPEKVDNPIIGAQRKTLNDFMYEAGGDTQTANMLYQQYLKDRQAVDTYLQDQRSGLDTTKSTLDNARMALEGAGETGGAFGEDTLRELALQGQRLLGDEESAARLGARKDLESISLTDFAAKIREKFPGQVAARELDQYLKAGVGTGNTQEQNAAIFNRMKRVEILGRKNLEYLEAATNSGLSLEQAQRSLSAFEKANPAFVKVNGESELNPNRLEVNLGDINFLNPQKLETAPIVDQSGDIQATAAPSQEAQSDLYAPKKDERGMGTRILQAIAGKDVVPPSSIGEALSNFGSNITSADFWLTRPGGERISAKQAVAGPLTSTLDGMTLGSADEIISGVNAGIDALTGKPLGEAYDQRLKEYRDIQKDFRKASPTTDIVMGIAGGSKLPIVSKSPATVKEAAKTGAKIGATYGFMSGEDGTADRTRRAVIGGATGATVAGAAQGLTGAAIKTYRRLIGVDKSAANKVAKSFSNFDVTEANRSINRGIKLIRKEKGINNWQNDEDLYQDIYRKAQDLSETRSATLNGLLTDVQNSTKKTYQLSGAQVLAKAQAVKPHDESKLIGAINERVKAFNKKYSNKAKLTDLQAQKEIFSRKYKYGLEDNINPAADKAMSDYLRRKIEIEAAYAVRQSGGKFNAKDLNLVRQINNETKDLINIQKIYEAKIPGASTDDALMAAKRAGFTTGSSGHQGWGAVLGPTGNAAAMAIDFAGTRPIRGLAGVLGQNKEGINRATRTMLASGLGQVPQAGQGRDISELLLDDHALTGSVRSIQPQSDPMTREQEQQLLASTAQQQQSVFPLQSQAYNQSAPNQGSSQNISYEPKKIREFVSTLPPLVQAMVKVESNYNPNAVSKVGARGLLQVMPEHYERLGVTNPFDPIQSIKAGATIFNEEFERFKTLPLALAAYNAGSPNVLKAIDRAGSNQYTAVEKYLPAETKAYVRKVIANMSQVRGA